MTAREFVASMIARAPHLNGRQRALLCRISDGMADAGTTELVREDLSRRERERLWEERELYGADLERRRREPA